MEKMDGQSMDFTKENIEKLKKLFPSIFKDGKIDFDLLKVLLGGEVDDSTEKYSFSWNGKLKTIKFAQTPTTSTLVPVKERSVDWDNTENIYIEGDNVEVLKCLSKTYNSKIDVIYIDPPYNTGKDFVYKDNFKDNLKNYFEITKQSARANPESNGRYHTDWLNMMYSRLYLAKNLLSKQGVIFISIDENEYENLKKICNEIFDEDCCLGDFIWKNRTVPNDADNMFAMAHEYILVYAKNKDEFAFKGIKKDLDNYKNPDNDPNGPWTKDNPSAASGSEKDRFPIVNPYTGEKYYPPKGRFWAFSEKRVAEWTASGKLVFPKEEGKGLILKKYKSELKSAYQPLSSLIEGILTMHGTKEMKDLFPEDDRVFKYPKPTALIKYLLSQVPSNNYTVMDFFSGSATTADAVMQLNADDGGTRKYILVQLPEKCDEDSESFKAGYKTICEIGEERIRRAGKKIAEYKIKLTYTDGRKEEICPHNRFDYGFKVFKLESTNILPWDSSVKLAEEDLLSLSKTIKDNRKEIDIVYEIMLKYGVFDKKMDKVTLSNKTVYNINDGFMIICLDENITMKVVSEIARLKPNCVVFKENGFKDDNEKMNATYTLERCKVEKILCI